jgi:hypothetical protein
MSARLIRELPALRPTRTRHRAACARLATALPLGLLGAAAWAAAFNQCLSKLAELDFGFVCLGQAASVRLEFRRYLAQEIEVEPLAIE